MTPQAPERPGNDLELDACPLGAPEDELPPTEYCPVSIGANLLGDRWTLLIVRELMSGATGFNDIHRGLPGLNRTMLSERLRQLERLSIVERRQLDSTAGRKAYALTESGRALRPLLRALGMWTIEWHFPRPSDRSSDPSLLLWRIYQGVDRSAIPKGGVCLEFRFPHTDPPRGWIRIDDKASVVCVGSPQQDVDIVVTATPRVLNEVWYGFTDLPTAISRKLVTLDGPPTLVREFSTWFHRSVFAEDIRALQEERRDGAGQAPASSTIPAVV